MKVLLNKSNRALTYPKLFFSTKGKLSNSDYQLYRKSDIPMLHFQPSLPRLPIPELEKTCERYLNSLKPITSEESFSKCEKIVKKFQNGIGVELQNLLKEHDNQNKHTSYISQPWFEMYLKDRQPLPLNYNPLLMFNYDPKTEYNTQSVRAANMVISSLRFYRSLKEQHLEPEVFYLNKQKTDTPFYRNLINLVPSKISTYVSYVFKAYPLDMSQYNGLFCGTRIPEIGKDRIANFSDSRHLIVMRNGNFHSVDVINEQGEIEQPLIILSRIKYVLADNSSPSDKPIGLLTTENRDTWAKARKYLEENGNREQLKIIDSALYCLCLDDNTAYDDKSPSTTIKEFLNSDGSNRWFDKSLSLIVGKDGTTGFNFEHSWGDGVAVLRLFNDIYKETIEQPFVHPADAELNTNDKMGAVRRIKFHYDDNIKNFISEAKTKHDAISNSFDLNIFQKQNIGRKFCKKYNISPDCFMQLGFQLAYYKQNGRFDSTYESCSTAAFRHGRTETMRPLTSVAKEFVLNAVKQNNRLFSNDLRELIHKCSKAHSVLTRDAAMGQGFDRHLFGLKNMALLNHMKLPELYEDDSYRNINYNILSTSTLSSPALLAGGFGAVVPDGYGIGYNIQENFLGTAISSYKQHRNNVEFIQCLESAYDEMKDILA